jgi:excisionase family DNA binding protein
MTDTTAERYLTVAQVASIMGVSQATVRRWARDGRLTKYNVNGLQSVRFAESEVRSLVVRVA